MQGVLYTIHTIYITLLGRVCSPFLHLDVGQASADLELRK